MVERLGLATTIALVALAVACPAEARVDINVDLGSQTMHVESAEGSYDWPISSARSGYSTPRGSFGIQRMETMHYSHKYNNAPMPHALFFAGGYAIHGTDEPGLLGRPASHGCIRIAPGNAAALYQMVREEGARITIEGSAPTTRTRTVALRRHHADSPAMWDTDDDAPSYAPRRAPRMDPWLDDPSDF